MVHVDHGNDLGEHQFAIRPGDGTEDFYAHCSTRPGNGAKVSAGQKVADVGQEGNATGPHLHFERHKSFGWSCSIMDDPMKSHNAGGAAPSSGGTWASGDVRQDRLVPGQDGSDSVRRLQTVLNAWSFEGGQELPITGSYGPDTQHEVGLFQAQVCGDPPDGAIGPKQTDKLFTKLGPWNIIR